MAVRFNPQTGKLEDDEADAMSSASASTIAERVRLSDPLAASNQALRDQYAAANQQSFEAAKTGGADKPMFASDPGQFVDELGNILGNAVTGIGTDFVDLGLGLADVAVATGKQLAGQDANWDQVFDDSDNPLTQWRRREFESETQAGKVVSDVVRLGTLIATLPKSALKGAALAPRLIGKVGALGDVAAGASKLAKGIDAADDAIKAGRAGYKASTEALKATGFAKGTAAGKAAKIAAEKDWLRLTFKEIADVPEAANWWTSVQQSTKALTQLTREKAKLRTVGEALAWDALATFSVFGEGDDEFDQTLNDTLREAGLPSFGALETSIEDTALQRKLKQMAEGLVLSPLINGLLDMKRVYQFSRNLAKATPDEKALLVKAFNADAEDIGRNLTKLLPESAASLQAGRTADAYKNAQLNGLYAQLETQRIGNRYQNDLLTAQLRNQSVANVGYDPQLQAQLTQGQGGLNAGQLMANQQMVAGSVDALPGSMPAGLLPEGQVQQLPGAPQPGMLPGGPEAQPPGAPPAGLMGAGGGELLPPVQPVQVSMVRPPEPVVSPQDIRNAFQADAYNVFKQTQELTYVEGPDGVMRSLAELSAGVKQLVPKTRIDAMDFLMKNPPQANELGVIPAADSVWMNFITNRGLKEGWASIDPSNMQVKFNRKAALDLDRGDVAAKQAKAMDELNELNRYQEWLWNKELVNGNPQMRPEVQDSLAGMEARDAYDQWEAARAADPAAADAERRLVTGGIEEAQLEGAEAFRISAEEAATMAGRLDDDTVVREYMGTTLDSVQAPEVVRAEVGRGWEVYSADGEKIASTRTQREANKLAESELRRNREAMIGRARQMEADDLDQALNTTVGQPVLDSELVGSVKLTDSQIDAIQKFSPAIQNQMRMDWEKRTGGQAFININDLKGGSKKTFDLTQGEMLDLADGIKALLQTGEITGPRARVLRNVADKLSTSMKLLEPQARAQRFADNITAEAQRFIDHGDFC